MLFGNTPIESVIYTHITSCLTVQWVGVGGVKGVGHEEMKSAATMSG